MKNWKSPAEVLHLVRLRKHWRWRLWQEKRLFLSELFDSVWKFTLCILKIFGCICIKVWLLVCTYHRAYVGVREDIIGCLSLPFFPAACTRLPGLRAPREGFSCLHVSSPRRSTDLTGVCAVTAQRRSELCSSHLHSEHFTHRDVFPVHTGFLVLFCF